MSALRRSRALLVPVVLLPLLALAPAARAEERVEERDARVEAALHHGAIGRGSLAWSSTLVLDLGADEATAREPWRVRLATPLPDGETLTGPEGVSAITEGGRIVGLRVEGAAVAGRALTISLEQPIDAHPGRLHLGAPLAAGDALQIIEVVGEDGARFEPDAALGLERRVGYFAPHALDGREREACERRLGYRPRRRDSAPLYVRAESAIALRGGIAGALVTHSERVRGGVIGAAIAFAVIVAALVVAQRRLARAASVEEADALLTAEFQRLERRALGVAPGRSAPGESPAHESSG